MASAPIRVLLIDDHQIVLMGLRVGLSKFPDLTIVGEALDGEQGVREAAVHRPDVALVDVDLPDRNGFDAAVQLLGVSPGTRVMMISGSYTSMSIERALELRLSGYMLKYESPDEIAANVRRVVRGELCFSKCIHSLLEPANDGYRLSYRHGAKLALLSDREREMVRVLARGCPLKQAAHNMQVTYKVADHMKAGIMKKLDIHDRSELTRFAIQEGLLAK